MVLFAYKYKYKYKRRIADRIQSADNMLMQMKLNISTVEELMARQSTFAPL